MTEQETSSGTAPSGAAFNNRRQKNLQKFRRHIASQKQTTDGKASSSIDQLHDPKLDEPSKKVENAQEPAGEPAGKCEDRATKPDAKPEKDAPKQQLPLSPSTNEGHSPMVAPEREGHAANGKVLSPQTSKRRHDIMKKLNKKSRHALTGAGPRKEDEVLHSKGTEDGSTPFLPVMSDASYNSCNKKAETTGIRYIQSSSEQQRTETIESTGDERTIGATTSESLSGESVGGKDTKETLSEDEGTAADKAKNNDLIANVAQDTREALTTQLESISGNVTLGLEPNSAHVNSDPTEQDESGVASDSRERANDLRTNVISRPDPPETKGNSVSEEQLCEPSSSFDLRSIHEFPPKPIEEAIAALPSRDPSWDTAKVLFSEFQRPASAKAKNDAINVFDTSDPAPWGANDTKTFSESFEPGFHSFSAKENKDLNLSTSNGNVGTTLSQKVEPEPKSISSVQSPRHRLSRLQLNSPVHSLGFDVSKLTVDSTDELDKLKQSDEGDESNPEDDANLLVENDQMGEDSDGPVWINDSQPTKEERLQLYTSTTAGEDDSSASSNEEEDDDESSIFSQEPQEQAFMICRLKS
jgi:hypothetical protein